MAQLLAKKKKEKTKEGHVVVREGSSEFFSEETTEERFGRILARYEHKEIQFVYKNLDVSVNELLRLTLRHTALVEVLKSLGGRIELKPDDWNEIPKPEEGFKASWAINNSRVDVLEGCVVMTDNQGRDALDKALGKFRKQLLES